MAKKEYNNYDDTLFGKYIRQIENPDSVGWDAVTRTWRQSTRKGDDKRSRGMGIDILNNNAAKRLTQGRPGQYLTEEEENRLRNEYLQEMLNVIERQKENHPGLKNMSPRKQAEVIGALYRGDAPKLWDKNTILGKALESPNEEDFHRAVDTYYNSVGLGERARNNDKFWRNQTHSNQSPHVPSPTITRQIDGMVFPTIPSSQPTITKQDVVDAAMLGPKAVAAGVGTVANYINQAAQKYVKPKDNSKDNTVRWAEGGYLKPRDAWDALSMKEKAEMIGAAVRQGYTDLSDIRDKYNEFAKGGSIDIPEGWTMEDEAKFQEWRNSLPENLKNTDDSDYDMRRAFLSGMQPELQPDGFYHLGSRDPKTGRILKSPHHPTYLEAVNSDARIGYYPITDDKGITYTDTWKGNTYGGGSYLDIAKQHIRRNEGFVNKPMKDAPKGKNWRSVGYGFNDSGFFGKYKEGISKHYENGISKADAEKELDWILRNDIVPTLQRQYGAKWNEMNDNQKAAIIDTYYQRPASVKKGSKFHSAVMSGSPNAGNYLGVTGFSNRNRDRRKLFGSQYVEAIRDVELPTFTPVDFSDYTRYAPYPELLENPLGYQTPSREEFSVLPQQSIVPEYSPEELKRQERREALDRLNTVMSLIGMKNPLTSYTSDTGNPFIDTLGLFANESANGGKIYIKPSHRGRLTELKKRTGKTEAELYRTGSPATRKMITFARSARKWKHVDGGNLFSGKEEGSQKMNIFRRSNGEYFYQASPDSEEVSVTPLNTLFDNPALWTYTDNNGNLYTPKQATTLTQGTITRKEDEGPLVEAAKNYLGELQYDINNGVPIGGKYTMPAIAASALLPIAGEAFAGTSIAGIPATTWANTALEAGFGAHGLQDLANGNADWMTALEIAPLGSIVRPMWNAGRSGYNAAKAFVNDAKANRGFAVSSPRIGRIFGKDAGQFTAWIPTDRPWSEGLSWINTGAPTTEGLPIQYITSKHSGEGRKLYDAVIRKARKEGHPGIVTGSSLISAPKTYSTLEHYYPSRVKLDDMGHWSNDNMTGLFEGPRKTVYTLDDFLKTVSENPTERVHFLGAPRYRLETPSTAFTESAPAAEWTKVNNSYLNGKQEIGMYFPDGKTFDSKAFAKDLGTGIADAQLFLGSNIKAATDAYNIELAKRIGFPRFAPYKEAQKRASVYVKPQIAFDRSTLAGSVEKNVNDPALDKMTINAFYDADKGGFHETLHRGNYGEEGFYFDPKTMNFIDYHKIQEDTRNFYNFKTNKLLVPRTEDNAEWYDYMSRSTEAATNSMEIGRRMGIAPGTPWPGKKKAMELFEKYATSGDQKTKAFNVLNWKQKPRRVWDAITGKYYVLGAGTVSSASLLND